MLMPIVRNRLAEMPALVLLGARQTGKTTLADALGATLDSLYLDLESPGDVAKLHEPELFLERHQDKLVILDEVHRMPELFPVLRGLIDRARRKNKRSGLYLLLGSASLDLLKKSADSLAGRISYLELSPFIINEIDDTGIGQELLWLRGGFPESLLADTQGQSMRWRQDFILTYLEREIPRFGGSLGSTTLRRLWTMLAHQQGALLNSSRLANNLGLDVRTLNTYLELMEDLFLIRRLEPWFENTKKRLVKSPKLYLRDSGLVHALLGIQDLDTLLAHPVLGASWEGFVLDQILAQLPAEVQAYFYRSAAGAEIDLVLVFPGEIKWAVEIKRSLMPKPGRGFYSSCEEIRPERCFVIYPGEESFPVDTSTEACSLQGFTDMLDGY